MADRLYLLAQDTDDIAVLSAAVQSAAVRGDEIGYDRKARRLVLMLSRYRWEAGDRTRIRAALRIDCVTGVRRKAWPDGEAVLELLAITAEDDALVLAFAGGATLRAGVECPDVTLEDLTDPWPAIREPGYEG